MNHDSQKLHEYISDSVKSGVLLTHGERPGCKRKS